MEGKHPIRQRNGIHGCRHDSFFVYEICLVFQDLKKEKGD
jgi:hypothetical protein